MPRFAPLSRFAQLLAVTLVLVAAPALGQVAFLGSVQPTVPIGFPFIGDTDANNDGVSDFLTTAGNGLILDGVSPIDPTGTVGGLAWNDAQIWRAYESAFNVLVGDAGQSGSLTIAGGGEVRPQHIVLGGQSRAAFAGQGVDTAVGDNSFDVGQYVSGLGAVTGRGGTGVLTVGGFGSLLSTDPNVIPTSFQQALRLGAGVGGNNPIVDVAGNLRNKTGIAYPFIGGFIDGETSRELNEGYDMVVGLDGVGTLNVFQGGRVEVQDALMTAVASQSGGTVNIDGVGSVLTAYGRTRLQTSLISLASPEATSFIGGRGVGTMAITNGGRGDFFNGLSIGAATGTVAGALGITSPSVGSGTVSVTGVGSTLKANASSLASYTFVGNRVALGVGELNTQPGASLADPIAPTAADVQPGVLTVADGGVVTASFSTDYGRTQVDANVAIGRNGQVRMRNGSLIAGNQVLTDGGIDGYGTVRANRLETSVYSVIRGGDDTAQNPALSEPLRLVLNGDPGAGTFNALLNRGLIAGIVDIDAAGDVLNEGRVEAGGEMFARSLTTTTTSRIVGGAFGRPLEIRLESDQQVESTNPAVRNLGLLGGNVNLITPGGLVNGANLSTAVTGANGGEVRGNGVMQVGTFLNNRLGRVTVGAGEDLSIVATGLTPVQVAAVVENGVNLASSVFNAAPTVGQFFMANLGEIVVDGGRFEAGRSAVTTIVSPSNTLHTNLFRNTRHFNSAAGLGTNAFSVGTITANDADLVFRNGLHNTGVVAFTGGDNTVSGTVLNAVSSDYNGAAVDGEFPGIIVVSGDGTSVTFQDTVVNSGVVSIGPYDNVVNFLGDYVQTGAGVIQVAQDAGFFGSSRGAYIDVAGNVTINGGSIIVPFITAPATIDPGFSIALITAGDLADDSLFTSLDLPDLPAGKYWDVIYDTVNDEVRLEVVMSNALGADFTGDGIVTRADVDVWVRNAGITAGAAVIQGDADLDGDVDLADYDRLMDQLLTGVPVAAGGGPFLSTGVPEPTSALLLALAMAAPWASRRR